MEAVWGAVLSLLFVLATLSGYGAGTPHLEKDKSEQSEKKDEDKDKKDEDKDKKDEKSDDNSSRDKSDKKGKAGHKDNGSSGKASKKKAEYCIKDCPDTWRLRP